MDSVEAQPGVTYVAPCHGMVVTVVMHVANVCSNNAIFMFMV